MEYRHSGSEQNKKTVLVDFKRNDERFRKTMERIIQKYSSLDDSGPAVCLKTMTFTTGKGSVPLNSNAAEMELQKLRDRLKEQSLQALENSQEEHTVLDHDQSSSVSTSQMDVTLDPLERSSQMDSIDNSLWCGSETSHFSLKSARSSGSCLSGELSQPEEEDPDLERTLSSHGNMLLDVYPSMLNQIGEAYRRQHVTDAASAVLRRYRRRRWHSSQAQPRNHGFNKAYNHSLNRTRPSSYNSLKPPHNSISNNQKSCHKHQEFSPYKHKQDFSPPKRTSNTSLVSTGCFYSPRRDDVENSMGGEDGSHWTGQSLSSELPHRPVRVLDLSTPPSSVSSSPRSQSPDLNQTYVVEPVPVPRYEEPVPLPRYREEPVSLPRYREEPVSLPRYREEPVSLPRYREEPESLPRYREEPESLPRYREEPESLPRYREEPESLPRYREEPESLPRYREEPVSLPKYREEPVSLPKYREEPVFLPKYREEPVSLPRYREEPVSLPRYREEPVPLPKYREEPVSLPRYREEPVSLPRYHEVPLSSVCPSTLSPLKKARLLSLASQGGSSGIPSPSYYRSGLSKDRVHSPTVSPQKTLSGHLSQLGSPLKARTICLEHDRQTSLSYPKQGSPVIHTPEVVKGSPYKGQRYPSSQQQFHHHKENPTKQLKRLSNRYSPQSSSISRTPSKQIDVEFMRLYHHFICSSTNSTSSCHLCKRRSGIQSPAVASMSMSALSLTPVRRRLQKRHREPEVVESLRFKRFRESCSPRKTSQFWPKQQQQQQQGNRYVNSAVTDPNEDKYTWNRALLLQCPSPGFLQAIRHQKRTPGSNGTGPGSRLDLHMQHYSPSWRESRRFSGAGEGERESLGISEAYAGTRSPIRTWDHSGVSASPRLSRRRLLYTPLQ